MDQHEDECLPGTRTGLLQEIAEWALSPQEKCIFWLKGMAGTGKSTISRTVAKSFKQAKSLGASFFFKRGEGDRGSAMRLFPTISRQLVLRFPELMPCLRKIIYDEPDITTKSLKEQFDKLILRPLQDLELPNQQISAVCIVIDALDECEHDNDIRVILHSLPRLRQETSIRLRVFLTSRPELPIRLGFSRLESLVYRDVALHDIPEEVTEHDISLFLNYRLSEIRMDRSLPPNWPGETDTQALVTLSVPLFIFAATVCRIFEDPRWDPENMLDEILTNQRDGLQLDGTYLPVLNRLLENQREKQKKQLIQEFREIVGTIMMLESPLSVTSLSRLIGVFERLVIIKLDLLHSVISIPKEKTMPIRLLHLSFRDFLLDPETREKTPLWVDEKEAHQRLAGQCLSVCQSLRRNICGLPSDGTQRVDVDAQIVNRCLPPELQYSCRFWAQHLVRSKEPNLLMQDTVLFLQNHFLHWVEAMSLLGLGSDVVGIINLLQPIIPVGLHG